MEKKLLRSLKADFKNWWQVAWPIQRTSQDKFMEEQLDVSRENRKTVIITAPRGVRKSFCALRRSYKFFGQPVQVIDEKQNLEAFYSEVNRSVWHYVVKGFLNFCITIFVAFLIQLLLSIFEIFTAKERFSLREHLKKLGDSTRDEFPTKLGIFAFIVSLFLGYRGSRRPKLIFDDPLNVLSEKANITHQARRRDLDKIRKVGERRPLVILSSNEGLTKCFADRGPRKLHLSCTFPYAQPDEFIAALKAFAKYLPSSDSNLVNVAASLTEPRLLQVLSRVPKRHALSIHWWSLLISLPDDVLASFMSLKELDPKALRPWLREVVLSHDLTSAETFRTEALAWSPRVDSEDRAKVAALVGVDAKRLQEDLPGRLALCWALVLADNLEVRDKAMTSSKRSEEKKPSPADDHQEPRTTVKNKEPSEDAVAFFLALLKALPTKPDDPVSVDVWTAVIKPLRDTISAALDHGLLERVMNEVVQEAEYMDVMNIMERAFQGVDDQAFVLASKDKIVRKLTYAVEKKQQQNNKKKRKWKQTAGSSRRGLDVLNTPAKIEFLASEIIALRQRYRPTSD